MKYLVNVEFHKDYVRVNGGLTMVGLTSIPDKGKANTELIKKLTKSFDTHPLISKSSPGSNLEERLLK